MTLASRSSQLADTLTALFLESTPVIRSWNSLAASSANGSLHVAVLSCAVQYAQDLQARLHALRMHLPATDIDAFRSCDRFVLSLHTLCSVITQIRLTSASSQAQPSSPPRTATLDLTSAIANIKRKNRKDQKINKTIKIEELQAKLSRAVTNVEMAQIALQRVVYPLMAQNKNAARLYNQYQSQYQYQQQAKASKVQQHHDYVKKSLSLALPKSVVNRLRSAQVAKASALNCIVPIANGRQHHNKQQQHHNNSGHANAVRFATDLVAAAAAEPRPANNPTSVGAGSNHRPPSFFDVKRAAPLRQAILSFLSTSAAINTHTTLSLTQSTPHSSTTSIASDRQLVVRLRGLGSAGVMTERKADSASRRKGKNKAKITEQRRRQIIRLNAFGADCDYAIRSLEMLLDKHRGWFPSGVLYVNVAAAVRHQAKSSKIPIHLHFISALSDCLDAIGAAPAANAVRNTRSLAHAADCLAQLLVNAPAVVCVDGLDGDQFAEFANVTALRNSGSVMVYVRYQETSAGTETTVKDDNDDEISEITKDVDGEEDKNKDNDKDKETVKKMDIDMTDVYIEPLDKQSIVQILTNAALPYSEHELNALHQIASILTYQSTALINAVACQARVRIASVPKPENDCRENVTVTSSQKYQKTRTGVAGHNYCRDDIKPQEKGRPKLWVEILSDLTSSLLRTRSYPCRTSNNTTETTTTSDVTTNYRARYGGARHYTTPKKPDNKIGGMPLAQALFNVSMRLRLASLSSFSSAQLQMQSARELETYVAALATLRRAQIPLCIAARLWQVPLCDANTLAVTLEGLGLIEIAGTMLVMSEPGFRAAAAMLLARGVHRSEAFGLRLLESYIDDLQPKPTSPGSIYVRDNEIETEERNTNLFVKQSPRTNGDTRVRFEINRGTEDNDISINKTHAASSLVVVGKQNSEGGERDRSTRAGDVWGSKFRHGWPLVIARFQALQTANDAIVDAVEINKVSQEHVILRHVASLLISERRLHDLVWLLRQPDWLALQLQHGGYTMVASDALSALHELCKRRISGSAIEVVDFLNRLRDATFQVTRTCTGCVTQEALWFAWHAHMLRDVPAAEEPNRHVRALLRALVKRVPTWCPMPVATLSRGTLDVHTFEPRMPSMGGNGAVLCAAIDDERHEIVAIVASRVPRDCELVTLRGGPATATTKKGSSGSRHNRTVHIAVRRYCMLNQAPITHSDEIPGFDLARAADVTCAAITNDASTAAVGSSNGELVIVHIRADRSKMKNSNRETFTMQSAINGARNRDPASTIAAKSEVEDEANGTGVSNASNASNASKTRRATIGMRTRLSSIMVTKSKSRPTLGSSAEPRRNPPPSTQPPSTSHASSHRKPKPKPGTVTRNSVAAPGVIVVQAHHRRVTCVAAGHDGNLPLLVSGGADRVVRVWDAETGACVWSCANGHRLPNAIRSVSLGGDRGDTVAATCYDGVVRAWDYRTQSRPGLAASFRASCAALSVDASTVLAIGYDPSEDNHGAPMARAYTRVRHSSAWRAPVEAMVYSRAGSFGGGRGKNYNTTTAATVGFRHRDAVKCVLPMPHQHNVFVTADDSGKLRVWRLRVSGTSSNAGMITGGIGNLHQIAQYDVAISPPVGLVTHLSIPAQGHAIVASNARAVTVMPSAPKANAWCAHTDVVRGIALSADRCRVASGSNDGSVIVWDAPHWHGAPVCGGRSWIQSVAFAKYDNNMILAGGSDGRVRVFRKGGFNNSIGNGVTRATDAQWRRVAIMSAHSRGVSCVAMAVVGRPGGEGMNGLNQRSLSEHRAKVVVISGGEDGTVTVFKLCSRRRRLNTMEQQAQPQRQRRALTYGDYDGLVPDENDAETTLFPEGDSGEVVCVDVEVREGEGGQIDVHVIAVTSKRTVTKWTQPGFNSGWQMDYRRDFDRDVRTVKFCSEPQRGVLVTWDCGPSCMLNTDLSDRRDNVTRSMRSGAEEDGDNVDEHDEGDEVEEDGNHIADVDGKATVIADLMDIVGGVEKWRTATGLCIRSAHAPYLLFVNNVQA